MGLKVLILGVNGFIGSNLSRHILAETDWTIYGMDMGDDRIRDLLLEPRFHFFEGDMTIHHEWIEYHVKKCDVVLPLAAIATPAIYVSDPLAVFELDFEANLQVVRHCVKHKKRLVFPSTSEVYGMSNDAPYNEETSTLVTGPINKSRWIYSSCKQLMDRVIAAYGQRDDLDYTLFRPFNWFGPRLDKLWHTKVGAPPEAQPSEGSSRVVTKFLGRILNRQELILIDGGMQKRCFLYVDDGIDALMRVIENKDGCTRGRIFNIGHPQNEVSIRELAETMLRVVSEFDGYADVMTSVKMIEENGEAYYGKGYQDLKNRVPCIENAKKYLDWSPKTDLVSALRRTAAFYINQREGDKEVPVARPQMKLQTA